MSKCCCPSGNCCGQPKKPLSIEFLYLDTTVCGRCKDTEKALDDAVSSAATVLNAAGYEVNVSKVNITTKELAIRHRLVSSPSIRINGKDIAAELRESRCEDCGELCGNMVDCRVWVYNGIEYTSPPKELIVDAILREVYSAKQGELEHEAYQLPANLEMYFKGVSYHEKNENL